MSTLTVGDLAFELRRSARRRTVEIIVDRGGELVLLAPATCADDILVDFIAKKRFWIYTKLAEKDALALDLPAKEFVSGEGFPYLGRSHRLLLVDDQDVPLKLEHGRLSLRRADVDRGRDALVRWYSVHASAWLRRRFPRWAERMGVVPAGIEVRDLGYRWGSCGKGGRLYFHWRTILLPPPVIDYIIVHELAHLHEARHSPAFWSQVARAIPDFMDRKDWLARKGHEFAAW